MSAFADMMPKWVGGFLCHMQLAKCFEGAEETFFSKRELELEDRMGEHSRMCDTQLCQTSKTRQKLDWKIREIDGSYLCLQRFDKFWIWCARNDWKRKLFEYAETCMKKFVKSHQVRIFLAGFSHLKPLCDDETKHNKKQKGEKPKKKKWASCTRDTRFAMRSTYIFIQSGGYFSILVLPFRGVSY